MIREGNFLLDGASHLTSSDADPSFVRHPIPSTFSLPSFTFFKKYLWDKGVFFKRSSSHQSPPHNWSVSHLPLYPTSPKRGDMICRMVQK